MTAQEFFEKTGRWPKDDDLERVNCEYAGYPNHARCGWCATCDRPRFKCGCERVHEKD